MPPPMQEPPAPEGLQLDAVLQQVSANLPEPLVEALKQIAAQIATLPPEEIQSFLETLDYLEQNKDRYQEAVQEMVAAGKIPPDSAPPQYDAALFSAIREVVSAAMNSAPMPAPQMPMEPPMGFARGGIAQLASQGRFGDNMLARINPQQANMLRARGGAGTINPRTGLREYFNLWKTLAPIVGAVAGAFLPFGSVIGPAVGSFAASKLAGNSTKDALMGAALAGVAGYGAGNSMAATAGGYGGSAFSGGTGPSLGSALFTGASKEGVGSLFTAGAPSVNTGAPGYLNSSGMGTSAPGYLNSSGMSNAPGYLNSSGMGTSAPGYLNSSGMGTSAPGYLNSSGMGSASGQMAPEFSSSYMTSPNSTSMGSASGSMDLGNIPASSASPVTADFFPEGVSASSFTGSDATKLLNMSPAELAKQDLTTAQLTELAAHKDALTKLGIPFGASSPFGFLGDIGKTALANPFPTALILSSLASLDQEKKPKGIDKPYGGKTSEDVIKENPRGFLYDPRSFGVTDPYYIKEYEKSINAKAGGPINGPGTGTSDSIPARLSDGEFVMTASAVRGAGGGDRKAGARKMYQLMHEFEKRA